VRVFDRHFTNTGIIRTAAFISDGPTETPEMLYGGYITAFLSLQPTQGVIEMD
jgi:hypothetical protein